MSIVQVSQMLQTKIVCEKLHMKSTFAKADCLSRLHCVLYSLGLLEVYGFLNTSDS
jgi:hypothetical protein